MRLPPISVIIASRNEEKNIKDCIERCYKALPNAEVIVVEGGDDRTVEIANSLKKKYPSLKVIHNKNDRGKGHGIRVGIQHATKSIMAQVDADCQFLPEELPQLVKPIVDGKTDITFCSRLMKGSKVAKGAITPIHYLANWVVSSYTSMLAGHWYTDVQAGFKAWTAKAIRDIDLQCDHFGYEPELAIMAAKKGYTIIEVPVSFRPRTKGTSKVNLWRDGILIPLYLLKVKFFRK